jgi:hypothetical protein
MFLTQVDKLLNTPLCRLMNYTSYLNVGKAGRVTAILVKHGYKFTDVRGISNGRGI